MSFERARELFVEGLRAFEAGRLEEAEARFVASLALLPGRASTLTNLAATRIRLSRPAQALEALDQALAADPDNAEALSHRGVALARLGRHEDALACWERVLARKPARAAAWYHRGVSLAALRRDDQALRAFERVLDLEPRNAEGWLDYARTLQRLGRSEHALTAFEQAVAIDPGLAQAWTDLGGVLRDLGRLDEAARAYESAIAHGGDAELNRYFLASLDAGEMPPTAPRRYVEALFDDYAADFDAHLVAGLGYQAHTVLAARLAALGPRRFAAALDLGCGTGLCGPLLRPFADRLDGVDLSERMIGQARATGAYDRLVRADVVDYLSTTDERYDLVVSTDVFIYVGELGPVFRGVLRVLRPGGVFAFSVELAADDVDFALRPSLRYAHSERYIRRLARVHGLEVLAAAREPLRVHEGEPLPGLYACLARR